MLFLSDSPYLKLLFCIVSTISRHFIITGYQFLYPSSQNVAACEDITDHRRLVMHVITTFVELSNPFPHHLITHSIFTVYHISHIIQSARSFARSIQRAAYGRQGRQRLMRSMEHKIQQRHEYLNIILQDSLSTSELVNQPTPCRVRTSW